MDSLFVNKRDKTDGRSQRGLNEREYRYPNKAKGEPG